MENEKFNLLDELEAEMKELMKSIKKNREAGNEGQYLNNIKALDFLTGIQRNLLLK